jgi:hypothetical protein
MRAIHSLTRLRIFMFATQGQSDVLPRNRRDGSLTADETATAFNGAEKTVINTRYGERSWRE